MFENEWSPFEEGESKERPGLILNGGSLNGMVIEKPLTEDISFFIGLSEKMAAEYQKDGSFLGLADIVGLKDGPLDGASIYVNQQIRDTDNMVIPVNEKEEAIGKVLEPGAKLPAGGRAALYKKTGSLVVGWI
ncbi:MAG: hypothetical protein ACOCU8_02530 [Patescibacteria group bacterium]